MATVKFKGDEATMEWLFKTLPKDIVRMVDRFMSLGYVEDDDYDEEVGSIPHHVLYDAKWVYTWGSINIPNIPIEHLEIVNHKNPNT